MAEAYDKKKDQIKESALKVFGKFGYHKTTLDDIAHQLGIKKNSLYYYYPSKEAIFNELVMAESDKFVSEISEITNSKLDLEAVLKKVIKKLVYHGREKSLIYSMTFEAFIEIGDIIENSYKEVKDRIQKIIADVLKDAVKHKLLQKHNSDEIAEQLTYSINAYMYKEYHSNKANGFEEVDLDKIEKRMLLMLDYFLKGLKIC